MFDIHLIRFANGSELPKDWEPGMPLPKCFKKREIKKQVLVIDKTHYNMTPWARRLVVNA